MAASETSAVEVNFDGLVGPTHNYAGLSLGNRASMGNAGNVSSPRLAALQGIEKMRTLCGLGLVQAVVPPHQRPDPTTLVRLGFAPDTPLGQIDAAAPGLLAMLMSASPMWAANAATVSPSTDSADGRLHLTPANLSSTTHRSFESRQAGSILTAIFADESKFCVHPALPGATPFADEGAANHGRFASDHGKGGVHLFVYGRGADEPTTESGFPRRQSRLASELLANSHGLKSVIFARQSPVAINAGAFHNDVVSVVNQNVLFAHESAFSDPVSLYAQLGEIDVDVRVIEVGADEVPLDDAISSYLFNSQLVTLPDDTMALIAPSEVIATASTAASLDSAVADNKNPIGAVHSLDLRESMRNGGGPACLRLRVVLNDIELGALNGRVIVDESLLDQLELWVNKHYRDELRPEDLLDPSLVTQTWQALDELTDLLELGNLYSFQS